MDPRMFEGILAEHQLRIAHVREQKREIPGQYVNVEVRVPERYCGEELAKRRNQRFLTGTWSQPHPAVEIPADNDHHSSRLCNRIRECPVIGRSIYKQRESTGLREYGTVTPRTKNTCHRRWQRTIDAELVMGLPPARKC